MGLKLGMGWRSWRSVSWTVAVTVALAAFLYGAVEDGPPQTNADRAHALARNFACPVCAGQSVAESDVPVAREIRRQIAVWVDEGRSDDYIRNQLVVAYNAAIDYNPSASGIVSLVWILPVVLGGVIIVALTTILTGGHLPMQVGSSAQVDPTTCLDVSASRRRRTVVVWIAAVVVVAGIAGVFVARFSGSRGVGDSITGNIRGTTRELIFQAQQSIRNGDIDGAITSYDEVLKLQPSNVEALTYRGWLTSLNGDTATAISYLDDAVAVAPQYPDARLFRAIVALDEDDGARAAAELSAFDELDQPPYVEDLIERNQVRSRVAQARNAAALRTVGSVYWAEERPDFKSTDFTRVDAVAAAEALASQEGGFLDALMLLDWILDSYPDDADVLAGKGWLLVRSRVQELLDLGIGYLDDALVVDPVNPQALVYRAFSYLELGDIDKARSDLAAFDALEHQPADLLALIKVQDLRLALSS